MDVEKARRAPFYNFRHCAIFLNDNFLSSKIVFFSVFKNFAGLMERFFVFPLAVASSEKFWRLRVITLKIELHQVL